MMSGPNVEAIVRLAQVSGRTVIASGGVSKPEDLDQLAAHASDGVGGAIVGKALYTGSINLAEAVRKLEGN
jgi:phosphoribosylformimino-5-aminoimidazole carboxamide ribotide isomerase